MDQWYYNRLSNASASFQTGSGTSASDYHQQLAGHQTAGNGGTTSSSTSQLLLQAAHGQSLTPTPFNAGFLTSPYDFPPLFSNASKNSAYVSPHRALTSAVASNKPPLENELSALRENYNPAHHSNLSPAGTSFSDHLNSSGPIGWPHQASTQLPFGVLPHESVGASSTGISMKTGPSDYAFYSSSQHLSQLADYKTSSSYSHMKSSGIYADAKRENRSVSPVIPSKTTATISSTLLYHGSASTLGSYPVPAHSPPRDFTSTNKQEGSSSVQQSQSCVVSTASAHQLSKDYGVQQSSTQSCSTPVYRDTSANREKHERSSYVPPTVKSSQPHLSNPAKGQSKVFLDQGNTSESSRRAETTLDSNQSSPISYSMVDVSLPHRYTAERSDTASSSKHLVSTNHNQQEGSQAVIQSYPQALNHQAASYRLFSNQSGLTEVDYHRAKPTPSIDATYNTTQQDGSDSASTQKKTSPHVSHSQPSPIGLVQNPAYLLYNSPMAPMASPSPLQHTESANSCHPGTSSPFKPSNQLVATAPLNVSTTRPETVQSQTVGYPSVITRTSDPLSKPTPYDNTRAYERNHETAVYGKHCWDATNERQSEAHQQIASSHQRKYQTVETSIASFNHSDVCTNISIQQQSLKTTDNSSERQHSYYDHSAVSTASSQDISSCRGDPMSIVKNLQSQQQQACQVPSSSDEAKSRCKKLDSGSGSSYNSNKRRKSSEKQVHVPNSTDYFNGRVPPPAHHNVSSQQQQGGSYFSNYLSTVPTSRAYNSSQATFHPSPTTLIGNQHQSLYMSPFSFPPLSLAGSTPTNSGSCPLASSTTAPSTFTPNATVPSTLVPSITAPSLFVPSTTALRTLVPNITSLSTTTPSSHVSSATTQSTPVPPTSNEFRSSSAHLQPEYSESDSPTNMAISSQLPEEIQKPVERSSKPIIPDIEEELSFLASVGPVMMIKSEQGKKNSIASGFEASYLKFLQGEREVSPPPNNRNNRRVAWVNTSSLEPPKPVVTRTPSTKGGPGSMVIPSTRISNMKDKSASCDPENDPRYFPLPKNNAQRKSLDSSDSEPDFGSKNPTTKSSKTTTSKTQESKPMAAVAPRTAIKQSSKPSIVNNHQPGKRGRKKKLEVPVPRRETSKRKAKEKGSILLGGDDDDPDEFGDSDSDPAWTPVASKPRTLSANIDSSDDDAIKKKNYKKGLKYTPAARKRLKQPYSDDEEDNSSENDKRKKRTSGIRRRSLNTQGSSGKSPSLRSIDDVQAEGDDLDTHPFKIGEFVVLIADLEEKWPVIWRVDGKTLLEKFAPYEEECETLYRNISTYSGWSPQNYQIYCSAPVKFRVNTKTETVVEFLRHEMTEEDDDILEALIKETMKFQDNFEVYIQTLISQALDSNFLTEIFQEHDEYFLSNVKTVDVIVDDRRKRFLQVVNWRPELEASIATWPCYNVMFELVGDEFRKNCAACDKPIVSARVLLYGQPYNSTTLEGCQPDPKLVSEKDFLTCRLCLKRIELYNKVAHQKYLMYIECAKRVNDRRLKDPSKDTTEILNELLADEKWLNELFYNVRMTWAKIDRLEQSATKQ